jgi:methylmalonyl-CoA mutase C-terminal domain/subunit
MKETQRPIRVLIAKPGLDGHDRGAINIVIGLRNAGMEVIYTGLHQTVDSIVRVCIQEDVDVLGLSLLTGGHNYHFPRIVELLKEKGMNDILVVAGGIIPEEDVSLLKQKGIKGVFGPGSRIEDIVKFIRENVRRHAS